MSAAHVSGAATLYLAQNPAATPAQVLNALLAGSKDFVTGQQPSTTTQSVWVGGTSSPLTVMLVASNGDSPTAQDLAKKTLFESWGYDVIVIDDGASASTYNSAIAQSDVAYVSEESSSSNVGTKLTYAGIGVLNEEMQLTDELSISNNRVTSYESSLSLSNATHYITESFSGSVALFDAAQPTFGMGGTLASGLTVLGSWSNAPSLGVLEAGAATYGIGAAAGTARTAAVWW